MKREPPGSVFYFAAASFYDIMGFAERSIPMVRQVPTGQAAVK